MLRRSLIHKLCAAAHNENIIAARSIGNTDRTVWRHGELVLAKIAVGVANFYADKELRFDQRGKTTTITAKILYVQMKTKFSVQQANSKAYELWW